MPVAILVRAHPLGLDLDERVELDVTRGSWR